MVADYEEGGSRWQRWDSVLVLSVFFFQAEDGIRDVRT